jgi:hypothetical protein
MSGSEEQSVFADWTELSCLIDSSGLVSRIKIERMLNEAQVDDPESSVENIVEEIEWRHRVVPASHPVQVVDGNFARLMSWNQALTYSFQLLVAMHSRYASTRIPNGMPWLRTAKLFEQLCGEAVRGYLGGLKLNVGAPRSGSVPTNFRACLDHIGQQVGELRGPEKSFNSRSKDAGVDVVAWVPFPDKRPGQVIVLLQCAAGTDWKSKFADIKLGVWNQYLRWAAWPLIAFASPFVHGDQQWQYLSYQVSERGSILFDRLRICVPQLTSLPATLQGDLNDWCRSQIARVQRLEGSQA